MLCMKIDAMHRFDSVLVPSYLLEVVDEPNDAINSTVFTDEDRSRVQPDLDENAGLTSTKHW